MKCDFFFKKKFQLPMGMNVKSDENLFMDILSFVVHSFVFFIASNKNCMNIANDGFLLNYIPLKSEYPLILNYHCLCNSFIDTNFCDLSDILPQCRLNCIYQQKKSAWKPRKLHFAALVVYFIAFIKQFMLTNIVNKMSQYSIER